MDPTAAFEAALVGAASEQAPGQIDTALRQVEATRAAYETALLRLFFAANREVPALRFAGLTELVDLVHLIETAEAAYDQAITYLGTAFPLPPAPASALADPYHGPECPADWLPDEEVA